MNVAVVQGRLSSEPRVTELASGDRLVRYEITVSRDDASADSVPVAWFGPVASCPPTDLERGTEVVAVGRVRRRWFQVPGGPSRSSTELLADAVLEASDRRRARMAIRRAAASLGADP